MTTRTKTITLIVLSIIVFIICLFLYKTLSGRYNKEEQALNGNYSLDNDSDNSSNYFSTETMTSSTDSTTVTTETTSETKVDTSNSVTTKKPQNTTASATVTTDVTTPATTPQTQTTTTTADPNAGKTKAPDFSVFDINTSSYVNLSSFKGKGVVINYWATWCGYCTYEMPDFQNAYSRYSDVVQFMMIDNCESQSTVQNYLKTNGYNLPAFIDEHGQLVGKYSISGLPTTIFVNKDGYIEYKHTGYITASVLEKNIKLIK